MKVSILTLGCRVNQSESNDLEASLKEKGITIVNLNDNPDYCIVNTCSVTGKGDYSSRNLIRRAGKTGAKVIVTGCYSQLHPEEIKKMAGTSKIVDINNKKSIIGMVTKMADESFHVNYETSRPYLKVQDGCNMACSYCIVPIARGRSRSLPLNEAIRRAILIEEKGFSEIVLTGIHLGAYGYDLDKCTDLKKLIKSLLLMTRINRIRLSSIEINEIDEEFIELMKEDRICSHLHLPLQSGSDRILTAMKRKYSVAYYRKAVEAIASGVDNIALGTDIICGFPGEEDSDFQETMNCILDMPFAYLHIFPYSPRPNTEAYSMKQRVRESTVKERVRLMKEVGNKKRMHYMVKQIGRTLEVIVEEDHDLKHYVGTSGNYLKVLIPSISPGKGNIVRVRPERVIGGMIEAVIE